MASYINLISLHAILRELRVGLLPTGGMHESLQLEIYKFVASLPSLLCDQKDTFGS